VIKGIIFFSYLIVNKINYKNVLDVLKY